MFIWMILNFDRTATVQHLGDRPEKPLQNNKRTEKKIHIRTQKALFE